MHVDTCSGRTLALPGDAPPRGRFTGGLAEIALPATGVVIGMALIIGPFLATVIRSLLYWDCLLYTSPSPRD